MIINIWSTPRTGSVWLMHHLKSQYAMPNTRLIAAPFEPWQNSTYRFILPDGRDQFIPQYRDGAFWQEFYLEHGILCSRLNHFQRTRTPKEEADYNLELFLKIRPDQLVILNSHVPIETVYFNPMVEMASRNIWIDRKNKRDQLASYAISMSCGTFTYFDRSHVFRDSVETCDRKLLVDIMDRIRYWDDFSKTGHEVVSFEDLQFYNGPGFPVDGNENSWARLGSTIKQDILDLIDEYETEHV